MQEDAVIQEETVVQDEAVIQEPPMRAVLRALPVFAGALPSFDTRAAPAEPRELFAEWFRGALAAGEAEPHAMVLATCDAAGAPDARVLILKDLDGAGWWFASSSLSSKGRQLAGRPDAALVFHWTSQGRQVRVRGTVNAATAEQSAADFRARSAGARAVALGSSQSRPLPSSDVCEQAVVAAAAVIDDDPDAVAPDWTLYVLDAHEVEFWQADRERRHQRLRYSRQDGGWSRTLLWP